MPEAPNPRDLLETVESALSMLGDYADAAPGRQVAEPLPSLLEQCLALVPPETPAMLRSVHHFACTGGTLISKCLGALPNAVVLSEIDPLSTMMFWPDQPVFAPTDLILNLRQSSRQPDEALLVDVFLGGLGAMHDQLGQSGRHLILRDHAHSQFCSKQDDRSRPTLREMLLPRFDLRSVVTVRHPVDTYLSLVNNGWHTHFSPATIEEYAQRYLRFLDRYAGVPLIRYEDFLAAPEQVLAQMCDLLALPHGPAALDLFAIIRLTGDSGRSSALLSQRPRRAVPPEMAAQMQASPAFDRLCTRLGYDPLP